MKMQPDAPKPTLLCSRKIFAVRHRDFAGLPQNLENTELNLNCLASRTDSGLQESPQAMPHVCPRSELHFNARNRQITRICLQKNGISMNFLTCLTTKLLTNQTWALLVHAASATAGPFTQSSSDSEYRSLPLQAIGMLPTQCTQRHTRGSHFQAAW